MGRDSSNPQSRRNKRKMAKAYTTRRRTLEAAAPVREDCQDHLHTIKATEGAGKGKEVRSAPSAALQQGAQNLGAIEHITREKSEARSEVEPRIENMLERLGEAREVKKPGWSHIGRVPGPKERDPPSRRPLQLPTEVCERIIDWQWNDRRMLQRCARVCKAWMPRCRYQMQRHVVLRDRSQVQGHARRARAQPHLLSQARSIWVGGGAQKDERAPIPHLGTFAIMGAAKMPLVWRLDIVAAIWKPSDFHPLVFVHLSAFTSLTTLGLNDVTFPKVREFGRLVCALPSLVRLRCQNVLFTSTAPCASLAITRCPPSVRLTDLMISDDDGTSSNIEANTALIGHLCAAGVVADLQGLEFCAVASSDSRYLDVYRESLHELLKQCSRSLRKLKLIPALNPSKDVQTDAISDTIASVFDLTCCGNLETVALEAASNFEEVGYAWMRRVLESNVSKKLREVFIVVDRPRYSENAEENLQRTVSALRKDMCPQLDQLFSNKDYEKLHHVDFVLLTHPDRSIPDATRWSTLLKADMPKLDEREVLGTRVDVFLALFHEDSL